MPRIAVTLEEKALEYFIKEIQDEMNLSGLNYVYKNTLGDIFFDSPASIRTHVKNRYAPRPIKNFIDAHLDVFEEVRLQKDQVIRLKTPKVHQIKEIIFLAITRQTRRSKIYNIAALVSPY